MGACEEYELLLSAWLDGELTEPENQDLQAHLARCPRCQALAEELRLTHEAFACLDDLAAPPDFAQGVMARIRAQEEPVIEQEEKPKVISLFRRPQVRALAGLAACALVCIGLYQGGVWQTGTGTADADGAGVSAYGVVGAQANLAETDPADEEAPKTALYDAAPRVNTSLAPTEGEVAGQAVDAVLMLDVLPQGADSVLGEDIAWQTDEATGQRFCFVTRAQLEELEQLARTAEVSAQLTEYGEAGGGRCALVLITPAE